MAKAAAPLSPPTISSLEAMFRRLVAAAVDEAVARQQVIQAGSAAAPLAPNALVFPRATVPAQTVDGSAVWDSDDDQLTVGTGAGRKTLMNVGDAPTAHGASAHSGDVLPDASDQTLGAGTLSVAEQAAPSNPAAGTRKLYVDSTTHKLSVRTSAGTSVSLEEQASGGSLTIQEVDGSPTGTFTTLKVSNGTLTDNGDGSATVSTGGGGSGNVTSTGAAGSEPGSPASGDLYLPNNGFSVERYSGSAWVRWGPLFPLTDPTLQTWAWVNQTSGGQSGSVSTANGGITLSTPALAGDHWRIRKKALALSSNYTITAAFLAGIHPTNYSSTALCWRESASGKLVTFHVGWNGGLTWQVTKWTNATTVSAHYTVGNSLSFAGGTPLFWYRLVDDGTNRLCQWSPDGVNWLTLHSVGRTDWLTADEVGFAVSATQATSPTFMTLLSWKES